MVEVRKKPRRIQRFQNSEHGAYTVLIAVVLPVILLIAGLIADFGRIYFIKSKLQDVADLTALAVMKKYSDALPNPIYNDLLRTASVTVAYNDSKMQLVNSSPETGERIMAGGFNTNPPEPLDNDLTTPPDPRINAVRVTVSRDDVHSLLQFLMGSVGNTLTATAVATRCTDTTPPRILLEQFCIPPAVPYCGDGIPNLPEEECDGGPNCTVDCKRISSCTLYCKEVSFDVPGNHRYDGYVFGCHPDPNVTPKVGDLWAEEFHGTDDAQLGQWQRWVADTERHARDYCGSDNYTILSRAIRAQSFQCNSWVPACEPQEPCGVVHRFSVSCPRLAAGAELDIRTTRDNYQPYAICTNNHSAPGVGVVEMCLYRDEEVTHSSAHVEGNFPPVSHQVLERVCSVCGDEITGREPLGGSCEKGITDDWSPNGEPRAGGPFVSNWEMNCYARYRVAGEVVVEEFGAAYGAGIPQAGSSGGWATRFANYVCGIGKWNLTNPNCRIGQYFGQCDFVCTG